LPRIERIYQEFKSKELAALGLASTAVPALVSQYARERRFTYPVSVIGSTQNLGEPLRKLFGDPEMGTTFIVDRTGRVVFRDARADEDDLRAVLTKLVTGKPRM